MTETATRSPGPRAGLRRRSTAGILVEFLGSMNLAITLLVVVSIASVIGTVLQQNQGYTDYEIKFGSFWFEVFRALGLYDVYSAGWFLFILAFLVVSTSVCVTRHAPVVWREITRYRDHVQTTSLRALRNHRGWRLAGSSDEAEAAAAALLKRGGYRVRRRERGDTRVLAAMKGRGNRLGYLFTHVAVVVIGFGALIDGNLPFKLRQVFGDLTVETRNLPLSQVPSDSRLPVGTGSFRGTVTIPEGQQAGVVFVPLRDGYVVQDLPFDVRLEDFRIRHYASGQPKSFESDLVILDEDLDEPVRKTISVNDPLVHDGYSIYLASFQDGGSRLNVRAWPLTGEGDGPEAIEGRVFENLTVQLAGAERTIEFTDFDLFNVQPEVRDVQRERQFRNVGPSFKYKLRRPSGEAKEFHNYLAPMTIDGARYFLSGMRASPGEPFRFLHIPADPQGTPERFMAFLNHLGDRERVRAAANRAAGALLQDLGINETGLGDRVARTADAMVADLREGGFPAVEASLEDRLASDRIDTERRETLMTFSRMVLERTLFQLYRETLAEGPARVAPASVNESEQRFFRDALDAVSGLARYDEPFWLQLRSFEHVQASGLQIARAPGTPVVYTGFALLIAGVFLLFYVSHRRMWVLIRPREGYTEVLLAGVSQRNPAGFSEEFAAYADALDRKLESPTDDERRA